jgi:parallel beta-helix repeat protein
VRERARRRAHRASRDRDHRRSRERDRRRRHVALAWIAVVTVLALAAGGGYLYIDAQRDARLRVAAPQPIAPLVDPGASVPGSTAYPVPDGSLFVSRDGSDEAAGTEAAPVRSVQQAVTLATSGQTIVVRGGVYHQRVTVTSDKTLTIQSYPGEVVWFDGSVEVGQWVADGARWTAVGWTTDFDSSPTFKRGAPDNTEPGWSFIDPEHPLAAHPDQVWIDDLPQKQVAIAAKLVPGTFAVDSTTGNLYLGTDPTGRIVRASAKTKAFGIQSENSVLRGIGVRRYATSVPGFGAVSIEAPGVTLENVVIDENATMGLYVAAEGATLTAVTVSRNGMMGAGANFADGLTVTSMLSTGNNTEHFNNAPVSGGFKITRSREVTIEKSRFGENFGPGLWFDQSNSDVTIVGNTISANDGHGLFMEISTSFVVAGNTIADNTGNGVKLNNTNDVELWNNTITDNGRDLNIVQDSRRVTDKSVPGRDERGGVDPSMTWIVDDIVVSNNVFSGATAECVVCVEDYSGKFTAEEMGVELSSNVYQRASASEPRWLVVWSLGAGDPETFLDLESFAAKTGQERSGVELAHGPASETAWIGTSERALDATERARSIPAPIRKLLAWSPSDTRMGAY